MTPLHVGSSYTHDFWFYPQERVGGVTETTLCVGGEGAAPAINKGTPPLKFPHSRYLGQRLVEKPATFLAIFMGLCLTPIISIWKAS